MKRFIIATLFTLMSMFSFGQVQWYQTTGFKQAQVINEHYYWPNQWQNSNMRISIDLNNDIITVYSPRTQTYSIYGAYNNGQTYRDNNGGTQLKYYAIDQDYDKCTIRLRVEDNGNSQIYIDFSNIAWVYNVRRIQ